MLIDRVRPALAPEYEILSEIAGGGMGVVFAARQVRLDRKVAIKVLRPELATAVGVKRFLSEGQLLVRLTNPHVVQVFDAGESEGLLYYAMEFVEGETLSERLRTRIHGSAIKAAVFSEPSCSSSCRLPPPEQDSARFT